MPRGVKGSAKDSAKKVSSRGGKKSASTATVEKKSRSVREPKVKAIAQEPETEDVIEEVLTEVTEDGEQISVRVTNSANAGNEVMVEESEWSEYNQKDLDAFNAMPEARKKYYDKLTSEVLRDRKYVKSGSFIFDAILSDGLGIPTGTFIEITAPYAVGKSSLLLFMCRNLCDQGYRCAYIDTERGLNDKQIASFGLVNHTKSRMFLPMTIDTFEEIDEFLCNALTDDTLKFIVVDSLTAASTSDQVEKEMGQSQAMGVHARATSAFLRRFRSKFGNSDKTIFFVAQNRKQFTMYGAQDGAAGGEAQKHYMDITVKMKIKDKLTRTVKGYSDKIVYGTNCLIMCDPKNRFCNPRIPMTISIIWGKGVSNAAALYDALFSHGKIMQKGSFYTIEGVNGREEQFRGENTVREYISRNAAYYVELVESLGGIHLPKVSSNQC